MLVTMTFLSMFTHGYMYTLSLHWFTILVWASPYSTQVLLDGMGI